MKKGFIIVAYWLAAIILTASILTSLGYDMGHAVIMSLSFLPAAMALSYFLPKWRIPWTGENVSWVPFLSFWG